MQRESFWSGAAVVAFSILLLVHVIPVYGGRGATFGMPPQLLPSIAAWIMLVSAGLVMIRGLVMCRRAGEPLLPPGGLPWQSIWGGLWPFLYVAAAIYLLGFMRVTYAGPIIIGVMLLLLGERRWWVLAICAVSPSILLYLLSVHLMRIGVV